MTLVAVLPLLTSPGPVASAIPSAVQVPVPPADQTGVGGIGFLIVLGITAVFVGLMFAMRGSLRRLRSGAASGTFAQGGRPIDQLSYSPDEFADRPLGPMRGQVGRVLDQHTPGDGRGDVRPER